MKLARLTNLALAAACGLASACDSGVADPPGVLETSGAAASVDATCTAGAQRCSAGTSVQACTAKGKWGAARLCATAECSGSACTGATVSGTSCASDGPGLSTCGGGGDVCCASTALPGGTFWRTYTNVGGGPTGEADQTTVSGLLVDKYLVTVGRFRQFVAAWNGGVGYVPPAGSGKHAYLNAGKGLANAASPSTFEAGWVASDDTNLAPTDANLACGAPYDAWTSAAGGQESLPINCVNWWEAEAFCIWDGGFLPSEAEWELTAAGGSDQREYPWGKVAPGTGNQYAVYDYDYPNGKKTILGVANIAPVGSAPLGEGLWGQSDLAGELSEWNLDWFAPYVDPCTDCANLAASTNRVTRGGSFQGLVATLHPSLRGDAPPAQRSATTGFRCARDPYAGKETVLSGSIQKGPFIVGSTVLLSAIDGTGTQTGQTFTAQTSDDLGDFGVRFDYAGDLDVQADGFYYDEVTGVLSTAPIALRALYEASGSGPQAIHINMVTHLAHDRALALMQSGGTYTLASAEAQAEGEVVAALGVGGGFDPGIVGTDLDEVGGNTVQNAYLFAVSSVFAQAAVETAGTGSVDAQLQEILGQIAEDLVDDGTIDPSWTPILRKAEQDLDVDLTMDLFRQRLRAIGSSATPASLNLAIDSDGDGYRNAIDTCALVANPTQSIIPVGAICKFTRRTTFVGGDTLADSGLGGSVPLVGDFLGTGSPGQLAFFAGTTPGWLAFPDEGLALLGPPAVAMVDAAWGAIYPADLDDDGIADLWGVQVQGGIPSWGWERGDGAGGFGAFTPFFSSDAGVSATTAAIADLNADGWNDVVSYGVAADQTYQVLVQLATAPGVFGSPIASSTGQVGNCNPPPCVDYDTVDVVDVDLDGHVDLVLSGVAPQSGGIEDPGAMAMLGDGAGAFHPGTPVTFAAASSPSAFFGAQSDFDGDGKPDVAVSWYSLNGSGVETAGAVLVGYGDGAGGFGTAGTSVKVSALLPVVAGDVDGDGKADLLQVYASPCANVDAFLSTGRAFAAPTTLRTFPTSCSYTQYNVQQRAWPTMTDVNHDGVADLVYIIPNSTGGATLQTILMNYLQ